MKKPVLLIVLAAASGAGMAQEVGRVISSTPVISQVAVPRQVCTQQQVQVQGQKSGAGTVMGAIAGGAIGNSLGGGEGKALATVIGLVGGAILGDRVEGAAPTQNQNVQSCTTQTFYENRTTAYNVVYEFNGKQYNVQMPQDPGPTVRLQVTPVAPPSSQSGLTTQIQQDAGQPVTAQTIQAQPQYAEQFITQPALVAVAPTVVYAYPGYYARPYYPLGVNLNFGWSGGHWGHRRWR